jgi:predicted Zn finger-like uncharacterized protein
MPISVTCPECNSTYRVADEAAGKAIKCKKCGARVPVPAGSDEGGAEEPAAEAGEAGKTKKKSNTTLFIILAVVLVGFCCICLPGGGTLTWYLWPTPQIKIEGKDFKIKDAKDLAKDMFKDMEKALKDNPFKK